MKKNVREDFSKLKILTIVGARPQFIKAASISRALMKAGICEIMVHTGQHYDNGLSHIFFEELGIPTPAENLEVGSGSHGWQTGHMLIRLEESMNKYRPDGVLVYGDTNTTLAGALAAVKLHIPLSHVEAGLRSFNTKMPEEHNRVITDHVADLLFAPTQAAVSNLRREGISSQKVHLVGDIMADAVSLHLSAAIQKSRIVSELGLQDKNFMVATIHRAENTDDPKKLRNILKGFKALCEKSIIVVPLHPRTRERLKDLDEKPGKVRFIEPVGYLDMIRLIHSARVVLTDSGGLQKEAYCLGVPCVTLRNETEWIETVEAGWNRLAGTDTDTIFKAAANFSPPGFRPDFYGDGDTARKIVEILGMWHVGLRRSIPVN